MTIRERDWLDRTFDAYQMSNRGDDDVRTAALLLIAKQLDRIADAYEEAHK